MALTRRERKGLPVGDFANKPDLDPEDLFYFDVYLIVRKRRTFSEMSGHPNHISLVEMVAACDMLSIYDPDLRAELLLHLDAMDDAEVKEIIDGKPSDIGSTS